MRNNICSPPPIAPCPDTKVIAWGMLIGRIVGVA